MPRPYNKQTVKDALLLLDIYASMPMLGFDAAARAAEVRPSSTGYRVAEKLVGLVADMFPEEIIAVVASEAAGLLREGWRIGDEIPKRGPSATLKSVDAILREQYPSANVEAMATASTFDLSSIERTTSPSAFDVETHEIVPGNVFAGFTLASPLDAVEEPTDEEIAELREDPTHEDTYGMDSTDLDTMEPSE